MRKIVLFNIMKGLEKQWKMVKRKSLNLRLIGSKMNRISNLRARRLILISLSQRSERSRQNMMSKLR